MKDVKKIIPEQKCEDIRREIESIYKEVTEPAEELCEDVHLFWNA